MLDESLYGYVWRTSREGQIRICLIITVLAPLSMVPLELQRRIVDTAVGGHDVALLLLLAGVYLLVVLFQGGLKYAMNVTKGRVLEEISRDLRLKILHKLHDGSPGPAAAAATASGEVDEGTTVSMLAAESEDIGGFASESLAVPFLQGATMARVTGYLMWVDPRIAVLALLIYAPQMVLVPRVQEEINRLTRRKTALTRKLGRDAVRHDFLPAAETARRLKRANIFIDQIFRTRLLIYWRKYFLTFLGNLLDALGPIIVLGVGGYLVIQGATEVSTLVVFISGIQKLADPWDQLVNFYRTVSNSRVAYRLVAEALNGSADPAAQAPAPGQAPRKMSGT
jgi:ABC-type multidrug transport system fused ATPase/permease subunit